MQKTTSTEFLEWLVILRENEDKKKPEHYYLAQIAMEVRSTYSKKVMKLDDFLFKQEKPKLKLTKKQRRKARADRLAKSKGFWMALASVGSKKGKTK
jgi:hypothetical protein